MSRLLLVLILAWPAFAQKVTATASVRVDGKVERVRKINGRWWSEQNRQMFPPKDPNGFFGLWIIDKESESSIFNHHRPFQVALAESLHLFMTPESIRQALGEPNQVTIHGEYPAWFRYYAADGTEVTVRFMQNHLLGEAKYERLGGPLGGVMVASVDQDLGGRSIYKILAEQANQQVAQRDIERRQQFRGRQPVISQAIVSLPPIEAVKPPAQLITSEAWSKVKVGMTREKVIESLGEPLSSMKVGGSDPLVETLLYAFEAEGDAKVRMEDGKVVRVSTGQ